MENEIWKEINGYEGMYQVSNLGRVKSLKRQVTRANGVKPHYPERILRHGLNSAGYPIVCLQKDGTQKMERVHRLVAKCFINNPLNKKTVNHINGVKGDGRAVNLEWATQAENNQHAIDTGLKDMSKTKKGSNHGGSKLKEGDIPIIFKLKTVGIRRSEIASMFNVSPQTITDVISRRYWKHVNI